ncbi:MAG: NUDIX hydrolase [Candidatus Woesearchaeota archaeon]
MDITIPKLNGKPYIDYKANIIAVEKRPIKIGEKEIEFERAVRSPGVRAIIDDNNKILLSKEYREELGKYDYRLPGGKVFDKLEEYLKYREEDLTEHAKQAIIRECKEELAITIHEPTLFTQTQKKTSIEYWVYFFVTKKYSGEPTEQNTHEGEHIIPEWVPYEEVKKWCLDGTIGEEFSALMLLRYLEEKNK